MGCSHFYESDLKTEATLDVKRYLQYHLHMASPESSKFSVSHHDWSLHRQGEADRARHEEKVEESIRQNIGNIVSSGDIIVPDPKDGSTVKIPIKGLE
jgi:hypothetical protein